MEETPSWEDFVDLVKLQKYSSEAEFEKAMVVVFNQFFKYPVNQLQVQESVQVNRNSRQKLDLLVKNWFVVEFKAASENLSNAIDQTKTYLRQQKLNLGIIMNPDGVLLWDEEREKILAEFEISKNLSEIKENFGDKFIELVFKDSENVSFSERQQNAWNWFVDKETEIELEKRIAEMVKAYLSNETIANNLQKDSSDLETLVNKVRSNLQENPNYYGEQESLPQKEQKNGKKNAKKGTQRQGEAGMTPRRIFEATVEKNYSEIVKLKKQGQLQSIKIDDKPIQPETGNSRYQNYRLKNGKYLLTNYSNEIFEKRLKSLQDAGIKF